MLSLKVVIDFVKLVDKFSKMKAENQSPEEAKQTNKQTNRKKSFPSLQFPLLHHFYWQILAANSSLQDSGSSLEKRVFKKAY